MLVGRSRVGMAQVSDDRILNAMKRGVDYLLSAKSGDNYEANQPEDGIVNIHGAPTCAVLYALGQVGQSLEDGRLSPASPELSPVVKYVTNIVPASTYTASYQLMALSQFYKKRPEVRGACNRALNFLENEMHADGSFGYAPTTNPQLPTGWHDNSNSQIAVLALWNAEENEIEVSDRTWTSVNRHWRSSQDASGGWAYAPFPGGSPWETYARVSPTMSAAGLASLFVTADRFESGTNLEPKQDRQLAAGLDWITKNFQPSISFYNFYYLYSIERVGLASGRKYFGATPWFATCGARLLDAQQANGSWTSGLDIAQSPKNNQPAPVDTAYALLFLARGRNPIMFNKLEYPSHKEGVVSRWNARPFDDAHVTRWMGREFEKPLNWQSVNLQVDWHEWLEAPILLITGSVDPEFTDQDIAKFKAYVQAGGTILSSSDGSSKEFTKAMQKYAQMVGDDRYEMRELPPTHLLFTMDVSRKIKGLHLLGLSNGARELWVHCPDDLGDYWERSAYARTPVWNFAANICRYCSGQSGFREKLGSLAVGPGPGAAQFQIALARLDCGNNTDPEPEAWPRLVKLAARDFSTDVTLNTVKKIAALNVQSTPVAHLTGSGHMVLPAEDQAQLKAYIDGGGTLIIDSIGGNEAFTNSMAQLLLAMYPNALPAVIPTNDELYSGQIPGTQAISEVKFRRYYVLTKHRNVTPQIQGIKLNGRWAVFFSPEDITSGLLGTNTYGILGYTPESSVALVRNMLLYAAAKHQ